MEFAFLYEETFGKDQGSYRNFFTSEFYQTNGFGIRVYRRGNMGDIRDFDTDAITVEEMERFVYKSTFVGQGPDFIRNLDTENAMKFFSQNEPGLILFYNSHFH